MMLRQAGAAAPGDIVYAIGDVHGRLDLLKAARTQLLRHDQGRQNPVVFLGDYVDRGPDSCGVIELLMGWKRASVFCLKGNHEAMMVQAYRRRDAESLETWLSFGGDATLRSYGAESFNQFSLDLIPERHVVWLEGLPSLLEDDHRVFVHGGLLPGVRIARQREDVLLWVRQRFLLAQGDEFPDGKHVVHGHTPVWAGKLSPSEPELLEHRTNLDTAAYATGVLTIAVFHAAKPGGPIDCISVRGE
ncbi:MAG TPA: metallophosphoesterase family protein, partial [Caulobacteraceae bacterium]|nr:metallophosphoesterase family protein [Caulobacteraceae bacterium]